MSMSGDHMYTLISMSPRMAQDGMWALPSSNVTVMHSVFTFLSCSFVHRGVVVHSCAGDS